MRRKLFRKLTTYVGKGMKHGPKKVVEKDSDGNILQIHTKREMIESKIINYNTNHYKKALNVLIIKDKFYE